MMNLKKTLSLTLLATALALAGCASKTKPEDNANAGQQGTGSYDPNRSSQTSVSGVDLSVSNIPGEGPVNVSHVVYFDFDSYTVKPEFQSTLQSHADFLRKAGNYTIALEGHTDDVGGSEYNLALGQRRADAVRQTLSLLGVPDSQMEAVSFGKEKPAAFGSGEDSRAENRRVQIRYNK